jgi:hypothetical protein
VEVKVKDGLARPGACVDHGPVAASFQTPLTRQLRRHYKQSPEEWSIVGGGLIQRCQMFAWNNERMDGRLRVGVLKGHDFIILEDNPGGYASRDDLAEDALIH